MTTALAGLKVLEIGQWVEAPYCTAVLADLGADVTKVERPGSGEDQRLTPIFLADTPANWLARMDAARIPCSEVMELEDILNHPHLAARNTHVAPPGGPAAVQRVVAAPIRMSDTPVSIHRSAPALGQDTASILAQLGSSKEWPTHARPQ